MAVAVDPQPTKRPRPVEGFRHRDEQSLGDRVVALHQVRRHPIAQQHELRGLAAHAFDGDVLAVAESAERADRVDTADETAQHCPILGAAKFGPAPALARIDGKAVTGVAVQGLPVHRDGRHDGKLAFDQLLGEAMFLANALVGPAPGSIELRHHETAVLLAELVDTVLVAVECEEAPVADEAYPLQGCKNPVGAEVCIGLFGLRDLVCHRFSTLCGAAIIPEPTNDYRPVALLSTCNSERPTMAEKKTGGWEVRMDRRDFPILAASVATAGSL